MARRRPPATPPATPTADARPPLPDRWWGKAVLLLLGVAMLSLAFAPFKQFYTAWVGLVPWLLVVRHSRGPWRAAGWSWLAGTAFFSANMWWLVHITGPGLAALMGWCGLYWAGAGAVLWPVLRCGSRVEDRGLRNEDGAAGALTRPSILHRLSSILNPPSSLLLLLPIVWVASEWLRGSWPFQGLAWLYLAHAQTPATYLCQIADTSGELGVSFWVAMVNGLVLLFVINGWRVRGLFWPIAAVAAVTAGVVGYGAWRVAQTPGVLSPGPTVLVVQPNYPQDNRTSEKGAKADEIIDFHVITTESAVTAAQRRGQQIDLVVWSETMMPPLNPEARASWASLAERIKASWVADFDQGIAARPPEQRARAERELRPKLEVQLAGLEDRLLLARAHAAVTGLARRHRAGMLVGSSYVAGFDLGDNRIADAGRRNSAVFYQRDTGEQVGRFDKIHLVPFGEYIPFKEALPWLYRRLIALGPPNMESYQLERGDRHAVFTLPTSRVVPPTASTPSAASEADAAWRFVTPICFEDVDADLNAKLFRGGAGRGELPAGGRKAADVIVNITNDGWFAGTQRHQHLQVAAFRSIENRAPTARSVNTGISGFIDSLGRAADDGLIAPGTAGTLAARVMIDARTTVFTAWGNLIGPACGITVGAMVAGRTLRRFAASRRRAG